ncbi:MAG: phosphatidate cytidylyltransferase [Rickettsiales bacterium]|jgi:phosphatidate cytidylyltransferase|nr:phosphatidate cytidylyltransferase [Rickettsiales bacterium]
MINLENLKQRLFSALLLIPIVFICVFNGGFLYNLLIVIAVVILCLELNNIIKDSEISFKQQIVYSIVYIALPSASLIFLRSMDNGLESIIYILFVVWATDSAAFFGGNYLKGPKLMPSVSPNKTISGALCGILGAMIIGLLSYIFIDNIKLIQFLILSGFLSIIAQIGDLFESKLKRLYNIKDASDLIPGHGGLLDRVDSLLFVAPAALLFFVLF